MAVVKGNYVKRGKDERVTAKANIRYIQERPGRDKEKLTRPLFDSAGPIGRHEAYQFIDEAAKKGRYFYRFKLSPDPLREDAKRDLNMQKLTRQMMRRLEKRLRTSIPWAGALHDDHTDIRHVHILAALPRRLRKYELETLIRDATTICREQRRELEPGKERTQRQTRLHHTRTSQSVLMGKRLALSPESRAQESSYLLAGRGVVKPPPSCTCPRCHFPQSHDRNGHGCVSCGKLLHKKREQALLQRKGRAWERSLS